VINQSDKGFRTGISSIFRVIPPSNRSVRKTDVFRTAAILASAPGYPLKPAESLDFTLHRSHFVRLCYKSGRFVTSGQLGHPGRVRNTRELGIARLPFIVVYQPLPDAIPIYRVIHDAMQWPPQNEAGLPIFE
jgi:hypothetical protein